MSSLIFILILIAITVALSWIIPPGARRRGRRGPFRATRATDRRMNFGEMVGTHRRSVLIISRSVLIFVILWLFVGLSIITTSKDQVGIVTKRYGTANLPEGRLVATKGETGLQAEIIPPGAFKVSPFLQPVQHGR